MNCLFNYASSEQAEQKLGGTVETPGQGDAPISTLKRLGRNLLNQQPEKSGLLKVKGLCVQLQERRVARGLKNAPDRRISIGFMKHRDRAEPGTGSSA
jgi:hypothetical protein